MAPPSSLARLPATPPALMRALAIGLVIAQAGIAVAGSVVRVTGSGLGCPGWPECFPGSLVPVSRVEVAPLHQWVEFSNRLLAFVVVAVAGLCLLAALGTRPRRGRLVRLAVVQPLGVIAQAAIGGVAVLTGLAWWTVAAHFLVSMVLVWLAVQLAAAASDGPRSAQPRVPSPVRALVATSSGVLAALLLAGTLVTAADPHAGDAATPRLGVGIPALAQLHADLLFGYLGLIVGLGFALRVVAAPVTLRRRFAALVAAVLAQGALGGLQYALGVPEVLVSLHVLGAALVTAAAAAVWAGTVERPGTEPARDVAPVADVADVLTPAGTAGRG